MANRIQALNLQDFSGGLNFRRSEFTLGPTEGADMLNVEVVEGGVRTRRGWERWNDAPITVATWNPRVAFLHEGSSGLDSVIVRNEGDDTLYWSSNGTFADLTHTAGSAFTATMADFAPWGDDLYIVRGGSAAPAVWNGVSADCTLLLSTPGAQAFSDDYTVPVTGGFVEADFTTAHGGRTWVAATTEDGVSHPHRVRWSHPNVPDAWASYDYVDILEGGGPITGIVPMQDHLLVFKASSVWAIFGYDGPSQQLINVSRTKGARSTQVIARSESACYFMSMPDGVFRIADGTAAQEVSYALRPMLSSGDFVSGLADEQWLGWVNNRLWWSVPYDDVGVATEATVTFVFDPSVGQYGSWTKFQGGDGGTLGPFAQGGYAQGSTASLGFARNSADVVLLDIKDQAVDDISGSLVPFGTRYTTGWLNAGTIDLKKRWKRPTFVSLDGGEDYRFQVSVRADYTSGRVTRKFGVDVNTAADGSRYGDGTAYGDGSVYSVGFDDEMQLKRGSSLGTMAATQLQIDGEPGIAWGLGAIVLKYRSRRMS